MTRLATNPKDAHGDPEGTVFDAGDLQCSASLVVLVKGAADTLERHYPGWLWAIEPDERGGVVNVFCMRLSGQWGYTLKIATLQTDVNFQRVMRAGGELLERFGFAARGYDSQRDAYRAKPMHLQQFRADVSDKSKAVQRSYRTHQLQVALREGHARIVTDADIAAATRAKANAG
jgi:hypothetical protein